METWREEEQGRLHSILQKIAQELSPLPGKDILVLCCGAGEVALWLGEKMAGQGSVVGLDLSDELLEQARSRAQARGVEEVVRFQKADMDRLPLPNEAFDALVSEFIIYPAPQITQIGQAEMARVLRAGGKMILTDVIMTHPPDAETMNALRAIGLDYLCEATMDDFREWMGDTGLTGVEVLDLTSLVKELWQRRREQDPSPEHRPGYAILLDDPRLCLGEALFYIYVQGEK